MNVGRPPAARECFAHLAQLGTGERDEQQRRVARPLDEVLDEVEERRLPPVDVVEHDHERPRLRQPLEHAAHAPEGLLGRSRRDSPEHAERTLDDRARDRLRRGAAPSASRAPLRCRRPRRCPAAERSTSATGANVIPPSLASQRPSSTDASPVHGGAPARAPAATCRCPASRRRSRAGTLGLRPRRRRRRAGARAPRRGRRGARRSRPPPRVPAAPATSRKAGTGPALPFSSSGATGSRLTWWRTSRCVSSPTSTSPSPAACSSRAATLTGSPTRSPSSLPTIDLAGVDAGAQAQPHAPVALELLVQLGETVDQRGRGADRAQRVVLAHDRRPEGRHHAVAGELDDAALVRLDRARAPCRRSASSRAAPTRRRAAPAGSSSRRRRRTRSSPSCAARAQRARPARRPPPRTSRRSGRRREARFRRMHRAPEAATRTRRRTARRRDCRSYTPYRPSGPLPSTAWKPGRIICHRRSAVNVSRASTRRAGPARTTSRPRRKARRAAGDRRGLSRPR